MRLLLVDDDQRITEILQEALTYQNYDVDIAIDGQEAWECVKTSDYDLLLLDVTLPKLDGIHLCHQIRSHSYQMPILMLTARDTAQDQIDGLDAGADDYVAKPYKLQELLARIRALLRRGNSSSSPVLQWENLDLDLNTTKATYSGHPVKLTPKEYRLLELFLRHGCCVLSRNEIMENLWSFDDPPEEDAVKALIKRLRQKLKGVGAVNDFIETVYGLGYRLKQNP
ncbi:MAG: response regulator transcription factor [Cyanobacteria bacterium CRU_2_1]|nr:response regulator transcription factor [Cyanobacteria bacterium RU_5_0]NJR62503.1 response regulator transcription factor [Cyanobacteria bacterium CRU_2_1]